MRQYTPKSRHSALPLFLILFTAFYFQPIQLGAQCGVPITSFPYHEDFETSSSAWISGGQGNDWAWGTPNKPTINTAGSGNNCWITGGLSGSFYSLGQRSFVESPCFDFTLLTHPYLQFKIWWESELHYDGANFQYSLDNGSNWINAGVYNDPSSCLNEHWYNTSSITNLSNLANPRQGWSGNIQATSGNCQGGNGSGGWVLAKQCMPELAGKPNVRFRFTFGSGTTCNDYDGIAFDDIHIENASAIAANFSSVCTGNNLYAFTDLSSNCPEIWTWNFGDPASGSSNVNNTQNPTHTFSGPGLYTVSLQASSNCSGSSSITFPVEVLGLNTSITPASCVGGKNGTARAEFQSAAGSLMYAWSTLPPQFGSVATHLSAGIYTVSVSGAGICPVSATVTVPEPDPSQVPVTNSIQAITDTTIALGSSVSLTGVLSDPGRVIAYHWEPPIYLDCDSCLTTQASPLQTTTYTLFATDTIGCVVSDALTIKVLPGSVYIPNVFKPNSDHLNGYFSVFGAQDVESIELLQIYDRWGSLIFENQNFPATDGIHGWDGRIKGKEAVSGVYLYVIRVRFLNGEIEFYTGDVTVVR
ncbi:MAG: gliding motility-associated C-terminal domain-containing protein [Saprospiraceae bacterium]|nr:gliding motility-associated C-terminal domain-containing protein [Saprospiraceae bacterium]